MAKGLAILPRLISPLPFIMGENPNLRNCHQSKNEESDGCGFQPCWNSVSAKTETSTPRTRFVLMSENKDGFFDVQRSRSCKSDNREMRLMAYLVAVSAGLIVTAIVATAIITILIMAESDSDARRRELSAGLPLWTQIPALDTSLAAVEPQTQPCGYLRGKCVMVEYNPLDGQGVLHPWHPLEGESSLFAQTPGEVETVLWLVKTQEAIGQYVDEGILGSQTEILTVSVIDLIERKVVGRWKIRGSFPSNSQDSSDALLTEQRLTADQVLAAIEQIPVKATTESVEVPSSRIHAPMS
jgi:hypothetical protein